MPVTLSHVGSVTKMVAFYVKNIQLKYKFLSSTETTFFQIFNDRNSRKCIVKVYFCSK